MIESFLNNQAGIWTAFIETMYMVFFSSILTIIVGISLGVLLFSTKKRYLLDNKIIYQVVSISLNALRSIPFLIYIFILIPINRFLFGTAFGNVATIIPISTVAISLYARFVEQALLSVPNTIIDRAISMGATKFQMIRYFLIPAIRSDLILSFTNVFISMLSYSTVVGVIGAGGLGDYAFRYGYQEYDYPLMYVIIIIFIIIVFIAQTIGYLLSKRKGERK
ncbi:methionine ABC transporter permease [Atopobacter phocae]|uniref:methionine ABC transporter permease n=1 Tax=Atopobacter phocae TaxID=136492 RepID=UPI000471FFE2|nr:methionine ABC transporter permease [Atopobacter phocae]